MAASAGTESVLQSWYDMAFGGCGLRRPAGNVMESLRGLDEDEATAEELRQTVVDASETIHAAKQMLRTVVHEVKPASRAVYMRSLESRLGPVPNHSWEAEWPMLRTEQRSIVGVTEDKEATIEEVTVTKLDVDESVELGWSREDAVTFHLLCGCRNSIARALHEHDRRFAASTYEIWRVLYVRLVQAKQRDAFVVQREADDSRGLPPPLYANLSGDEGLDESEPWWSQLLEGDATGCCAVTSETLVVASCSPEHFFEGGMASSPGRPKRLPGSLVGNSDVVRFEPAHEDSDGAHAPVMISSSRGAFPPHTLFTLKEVHESGAWEAPGGVRPKQRLLVVTATFRPPPAHVLHRCSDGADGATRLCGSVAMLTHGERGALIDGLQSLLFTPVLTMEQEFDRPIEWIDFDGHYRALRTEWIYVNGPAVSCDETARDVRNDGRTPQSFLDEVNNFVVKRRAEGHGTQIAEAHALLTLDEVLAVRLYTGASFYPINDFLRQVARLTGTYRKELAELPRLTFCATVQHLCAAIRKLAAVSTREERSVPLWRGLRGALPPSFWQPDAAGDVLATDMAFQSTSAVKQAPISAMSRPSAQQPCNNTLWCFQPAPNAQSRGADISMLSQYAHEREVLFPPCTVLEVRKTQPESTSASGHPCFGTRCEEGGVVFWSVDVTHSSV